MQAYKIVEILPPDAYYTKKEELEGTIVYDRDSHQRVDGSYWGDFTLPSKEPIIFHRVKLEKVEKGRLSGDTK